MQMNGRFPGALYKERKARIAFIMAAIGALLIATAAGVYAQKKAFNRKYPTSKNVRLVLKNTYGTITVEAWNRDEVKVTASMDSPVARLTPIVTGDTLEIDVVRENRGREDVGDVNFKVWVPVNSTVDIETRRGQISDNGVQGATVRAHVLLGGDIYMTDIRASRVMAENTTGDILFDGELISGGTYEIKSAEGNISIRIPANSEFRLVASAPISRRITLDSFSRAGLSFIGDGRKVVGNVGDGRAMLSIMNYRGSITFIRR